MMKHVSLLLDIMEGRRLGKATTESSYIWRAEWQNILSGVDEILRKSKTTFYIMHFPSVLNVASQFVNK